MPREIIADLYADRLIKLMTKRIILVLFGIVVLAGLLAGIKFLQIRTMIAAGNEFKMPPTTVTTAVASSETWTSSLHTVGTLSAVQGVTVAAELAGKITRIAFEAGKEVRRGELLVQQDISSEQAQLPGAEAQVALTRLNLERNQELLEKNYLSRAEYDAAEAAFRQALSEVERIKAEIAKKTLRAPFSGRLGIRLVDLGQMLVPGQEIVTLQALDPLFVEFLLPQQQLDQVRLGLPVRLSGDAVSESVIGTISAINPKIDEATRNVRLQATVANRNGRLRPGMFVTVEIELPGAREVVRLPATAILYAPYGDSVFVVEAQSDSENIEKGLVLKQKFVRLGERRGDFVAILSGVEAADQVVSSGVFKLRNGMPVVVDNRHEPDFQLAPEPENR